MSEIVVTDEWLDLLQVRLWSPKPDGFRVECRVLYREVRQLKTKNDGMRRYHARGDISAESVAERCEVVAKDCDSSLHEVAALTIRRLLSENARLADIAADDSRHRPARHLSGRA